MKPARPSPGPWEYREKGLHPAMMWVMYASPQQCHAMHDAERSNTRLGSTKLSSVRGTLREPPPGQGAQSPRRGATTRLGARDIRKPLTISVRFVGNGDCEWVVEARGKRFKFAGCENVHECLARLSRAYSS